MTIPRRGNKDQRDTEWLPFPTIRTNDVIRVSHDNDDDDSVGDDEDDRRARISHLFEFLSLWNYVCP